MVYTLYEDKGRLVLGNNPPEKAFPLSVIVADDWQEARDEVRKDGDYGYRHVEGYGFYKGVDNEH
jgi:hypothetical protein